MSHKDRKRPGPIVLIGFILAVCIGGLLIGRALFGSRADDVTIEQPETEADSRPRLIATRVVGRRQGERQFELEAGAIGDDGDWVVLENIENGLLYRDGDVFVSFAAEGGRWHRPTNNLELYGNVHLHYDERVTMRTERLQWMAEREVVVSDEPVELSIDGDTVRALSMEANLDDERVQLEGDVRIVRPSGDRVSMPTVVYWLAEDRLEGYGRGQLLFRVGDTP